MPTRQRTPEQELAYLQDQERKLKARRKAAEDKLRRERERQAQRHVAELVQVLKRHGLSKLTPERLEKALASIA
jgi:ribonuclease D